MGGVNAGQESAGVRAIINVFSVLIGNKVR